MRRESDPSIMLGLVLLLIPAMLLFWGVVVWLIVT